MGKYKFVWTDLTSRIAGMTGLYENQIRRVMIAAVKCIIYDLAHGKDVYFFSVGRFFLQHRKPRKGRNPYLAKTVDLGERYVPKFEYGKRAKKYIRDEATKHLIGGKSK